MQSRTAIVPIYKSEDHIRPLFDYLNFLSRAVGNLEVLFVIDGSPDNSESMIMNLRSQSQFSIRIVRLSRNFGVGPALHAALSEVESESIVIISSDMQEPVELYIEFFRRLEASEADVFLGSRLSRDDPFTMRLFSSFFWWVNRRFIQSDTPKGGFDGVGMSKRAYKALSSLPELNTSFTSQLRWIGYRQVFVPFHRTKRYSGKSTWTFRRKVKLFADSIYGFTATPISIFTIVGFVSTLCLSIVTVLTITGSLLGLVDVPGYTTLVLMSGLGHAVTLLGLGVLGGYVQRSFENSKGRPRYIIESSYHVK